MVRSHTLMVWSHLPAQEKFSAEWVVVGVRPNVVYSPGPGLGPWT